MNPLIQLKQTTLLFVIALLLAWFGPLSKTLATDLGGVLPGNNTADGIDVLINRTTGLNNSGFGFEALEADRSGNYNTATGFRALFGNATGSYNTADGAAALAVNNGSYNTANGFQALYNNGLGFSNTATGYQALLSNTSGAGNTATGYRALYHNDGIDNTAIGYNALVSNFLGGDNTAVGLAALEFNNTGDVNTAIGEAALQNCISGVGNIAVGYYAGSAVTTAVGVICIGTAGANVNYTTWIGNVYNTRTQSGTTAPVIVSDSGQLGTVASSERFKKDIASMEKASEAILSLRPVTFHYKTDTKGTPQFGLIAEEVAKVNPALVLPDKEGKPYTVRYDAVNAMFLNEFLKEHRQVQDLKAIAAEQQKQIEALTAGLQKVSAQVEMNRTAPQMIANER